MADSKEDIVLDLPLGTTVRGIDGELVACHPDHNPIIVTDACFNQIIVEELRKWKT